MRRRSSGGGPGLGRNGLPSRGRSGREAAHARAAGDVDTATVEQAAELGLPGHPLSALVVFELFVRPFVRAMLGLAGDGRAHVLATPEARIEKDPKLAALSSQAARFDMKRMTVSSFETIVDV